MIDLISYLVCSLIKEQNGTFQVQIDRFTGYIHYTMVFFYGDKSICLYDPQLPQISQTYLKIFVWSELLIIINGLE